MTSGEQLWLEWKVLWEALNEHIVLPLWGYYKDINGRHFVNSGGNMYGWHPLGSCFVSLAFLGDLLLELFGASVTATL